MYMCVNTPLQSRVRLSVRLSVCPALLSGRLKMMDHENYVHTARMVHRGQQRNQNIHTERGRPIWRTQHNFGDVQCPVKQKAQQTLR